MSSGIKGLAGEAIIYGATTMIGRLLNWLLMPFYIRTLTTGEYGVIVNIYGVISILLVVFTYGLETGFFRFSKEGKNPSVYSTSLIMLGCSSVLLVTVSWLFSPSLSDFFYGGNYHKSVFLMGLIVAFDSFLSIPFANLRLENKAVRFGIIKLTNIFLNIFFNLFFLLAVPWLIKHHLLSDFWQSLYAKGNGVFYVLLSNLIASAGIALFFISDFKLLKFGLNRTLATRMLSYSWPVLLVGITGMITQNSDKILMPKLIKNNGLEALAIYGANFKIGVLMSLFTQSFRFAFEPYFFKNEGKGVMSYARIMDYFIFFGLVIFLGVILFMDVINIILTKEYLSGNIIIPAVLLGQLFYGIYFNLSLWYKLTDKTIYGAFFGFLGMVVTLVLNFLLIPLIGIIGGALAMLAGYLLMMIVSYFLGQHYFKVPYPLRRISIYFLGAVLVYYLNGVIDLDAIWLTYFFKSLLFLFFALIFVLVQKKLSFK
ncbi:lipopolysaccharide biosynthesis protein [Geofilum sp. OHC36d9]|uniref:lipopolysaccharide biosynthesis protein n=1 Tax=Geofilum sp. OHC36d9 TaxID=3458413 RepID=UPI0040339873